MEIRPFRQNEKPELLALWEASVRATHAFLAPEDFERIKAMLQGFDFSSLPVLGLWEESRMLGFCGCQEGKLEMLFIHPEERQKGYGKLLMSFALRELSIHSVDVNEQNHQAIGFYRSLGFSVQARSALDSMGLPYPILHLKKTG